MAQNFRPEFLNRFDGIVLFKALDRPDIIEVAKLMFKRVTKDLEAKGIELQAEPAAFEFLADVGFDPGIWSASNASCFAGEGGKSFGRIIAWW